ncbi:MAG: hypothetical protein H6878_01810 [Rhodobiaceae bacterium]|nr:hypothetical protein [Rhodobiaceae bacterium]
MSAFTDFAKRITPLDAIVRRPPGLYQHYRQQLRFEDTLDICERRALQGERVENTIAQARKAAHYRDLPAGTTLRELPILEKQDIRRHGEAMRPAGMRLAARAVTSGSTGVPLVLWRSPACVAYEQATVDHLISMAGFDPLNARVLLMRADTFKHPDDTSPPYGRQITRTRAALSAQHLHGGTFAAYSEFIEAFRPDFLFVYSATFDLLLRLMEQQRTGLRIPLVMTSCEVPASDLRARAARQLGAVMLDYYGQAERVACAYSLTDGEYWLRPGYGAVEFLRGDDGMEIVATGLRNGAQMLLRYRTGDVAGVDDDASEERLEEIALGMRHFRGISGRTSEYLVLEDGSRVVGLNHIVRDVRGIASAQILQKDFDFIELVVVPASDFDESSIATIKARLEKKVPSRVRYSIRLTETPCRTRAGKAPLFFSELEPAP